MDRRKFLIGMGSLAAGGAAAMGTGAFTEVQAERDITVDVADDANAFLAIEPADTPNGNAYANEKANGNVELVFDEQADFTGVSGTGGGEGINDRALVEFKNLLTITNKGTQDVALRMTFEGQTSDDYSGNMGGVAPTGPITRKEYKVTLSPGESITTGVWFNLKKDANFEDYIESIETMTIHADADET